eukprot:m.166039 g.166039  ORF g.166039 m.166039 type:complete len:1005 (-) comp12638_c0_seq1:109-3123(-)
MASCAVNSAPSGAAEIPTTSDAGPAESLKFRDTLADHKSDGHVVRRMGARDDRNKYNRHDSLQLELERGKHQERMHGIYLEDIASWFQDLFPGHERAVGMNRGNVIERLMDGVLLGMLANVVHDNLAQWTYKTKGPATDIQPPVFKKDAKPGSFQARANIHNFIEWTRSLGVPMSFETADVMDGGRAFHVSACLMDVARGAPYLCALPALVEFERDIDAADKEGGDDVFQDDAGSEHGSGDGDHTACASPDDDGERDRVAEANSIEALQAAVDAEAERQRREAEEAPEVKAADEKGKFWIKGQKMHIRAFNSHVVVRVGGGWDTLTHYLTTLGEHKGFSPHVIKMVEKQLIESLRKGVTQPKRRRRSSAFSGLAKPSISDGPRLNTVDLQVSGLAATAEEEEPDDEEQQSVSLRVGDELHKGDAASGLVSSKAPEDDATTTTQPRLASQTLSGLDRARSNASLQSGGGSAASLNVDGSASPRPASSPSQSMLRRTASARSRTGGSGPIRCDTSTSSSPNRLLHASHSSLGTSPNGRSAGSPSSSLSRQNSARRRALGPRADSDASGLRKRDTSPSKRTPLSGTTTRGNGNSATTIVCSASAYTQSRPTLNNGDREASETRAGPAKPALKRDESVVTSRGGSARQRSEATSATRNTHGSRPTVGAHGVSSGRHTTASAATAKGPAPANAIVRAASAPGTRPRRTSAADTKAPPGTALASARQGPRAQSASTRTITSPSNIPVAGGRSATNTTMTAASTQRRKSTAPASASSSASAAGGSKRAPSASTQRQSARADDTKPQWRPFGGARPCKAFSKYTPPPSALPKPTHTARPTSAGGGGVSSSLSSSTTASSSKPSAGRPARAQTVDQRQRVPTQSTSTMERPMLHGRSNLSPKAVRKADSAPPSSASPDAMTGRESPSSARHGTLKKLRYHVLIASTHTVTEGSNEEDAILKLAHQLEVLGMEGADRYVTLAQRRDWELLLAAVKSALADGVYMLSGGGQLTVL